MPAIVVVNSDILHRACDLLVLKHADGFFGVDELVAQKIGFTGQIPEGEHCFLQGKNVEARKVLFVGVGPLSGFRYPQIRAFAYRALELAGKGRGRTATICTPIHGPGYGLDEAEAFLSLVGGFSDAIEQRVYPEDLNRIEIVEANSKRAERLASILNKIGLSKRKHLSHDDVLADLQIGARSHRELATYGAASEQKPKVFVAMPFKANFNDEWEIAIQEAGEAAGIICEQIDKQAYVGDILTQIKKRISDYDGVLALLNESNPNVCPEIGYAWAKNKPTILMMKASNRAPFDIQGQKYIEYTSIAGLRKKLREELIILKRQVFSPL